MLSLSVLQNRRTILSPSPSHLQLHILLFYSCFLSIFEDPVVLFEYILLELSKDRSDQGFCGHVQCETHVVTSSIDLFNVSIEVVCFGTNCRLKHSELPRCVSAGVKAASRIWRYTEENLFRQRYLFILNELSVWCMHGDLNKGSELERKVEMLFHYLLQACNILDQLVIGG